jgi:hypothetical protein
MQVDRLYLHDLEVGIMNEGLVLVKRLKVFLY